MNDRLSADKLANMSNSELAAVSSQVTGRLNNQDWQNIVRDLQVSGHIHTVYDSAPPLLQRYMRLEIDLDKELARRGSNAPLMSSIKLEPPRPRGTEPYLRAVLSSQDASASVMVEIHPDHELMSLAFGIQNLLTLRFNLDDLDKDERHTFLEMARRDSGLTLLWTPERWEQDYLVFVRQEFFTRVYAFSASFEAMIRLSDEVTLTLLDWLDRAWFARDRQQRRKERGTQVLHPGAKTLPTSLTDGSAQAVVTANRTTEGQLDKLLERLAAMDETTRQSLITYVGSKGKTLQLIFDGLRVASTDSREALKGVLEANTELQTQIQEFLKTPPPPPEPPPAPPQEEEADKFTW
jgi:hypothetical protein